MRLFSVAECDGWVIRPGLFLPRDGASGRGKVALEVRGFFVDTSGPSPVTRALGRTADGREVTPKLRTLKKRYVRMAEKARRNAEAAPVAVGGGE